jgi:signal transduction histidine kinase
VRLEGDEAKLYIIDNGRGFDPTVMENNKNGSHYGLQGIRERLELIRGSLSLESGPNQGTTLFVTVPKNPLLLVGR